MRIRVSCTKWPMCSHSKPSYQEQEVSCMCTSHTHLGIPHGQSGESAGWLTWRRQGWSAQTGLRLCQYKISIAMHSVSPLSLATSWLPTLCLPVSSLTGQWGRTGLDCIPPIRNGPIVQPGGSAIGSIVLGLTWLARHLHWSTSTWSSCFTHSQKQITILSLASATGTLFRSKESSMMWPDGSIQWVHSTVLYYPCRLLQRIPDLLSCTASMEGCECAYKWQPQWWGTPFNTFAPSWRVHSPFLKRWLQAW